MMREDCWCSEDEEYVAGVLEAKFIMWRLCAGVFRRNGCDAKSSVCLKRVNAVIGVLVFAGIKQLNELFAGKRDDRFCCKGTCGRKTGSFGSCADHETES